MSDTEERFAMRRQVEDDRIVVHVRGEIDMMVADDLHAELLDAVKQSPRTDVDFTELTFLDSTGIRTFIDARSAAQALGHHLYVVNATGMVLRVLEVTGVMSLLTVPEQPDPGSR
ncbi:STAS domain-containing protein [Catellatospora methionotrophica]|uniref:STAS domain-containing protein n=1 Tax=Catellatospora methionotrophica TaxID=121620 RepID=UPI0033EF9BB3